MVHESFKKAQFLPKSSRKSLHRRCQQAAQFEAAMSFVIISAPAHAKAVPSQPSTGVQVSCKDIPVLFSQSILTLGYPDQRR